MRHAESVTLGGQGGLDRAAALRADPARQEALRADPRSRFLPMWRGRPMFTPQGLALLALSHALAEGRAPDLFLGTFEGVGYFALDLSAWEPVGIDSAAQAAFFDPSEQPHPLTPPDHRFVELRQRMTQITPLEAELAATARGLLEWHKSHRFCPRCGGTLAPSHAGWQQNCTQCKGAQFPRTDPVVIMLVTHGDKLLLGRSHGWPEGMYSTLAGFIEPGETIEAAVRREVFEEAGVQVGAVRYLASQPWPFPASLMIGCHGEALSQQITIDPTEIEDAIWVSRQELLEAFRGEHPTLKPARRGAIAQFLMQAWLADTLD